MTSPALGRVGAALAAGGPFPDDVAAAGRRAANLDPGRNVAADRQRETR